MALTKERAKIVADYCALHGTKKTVEDLNVSPDTIRIYTKFAYPPGEAPKREYIEKEPPKKDETTFSQKGNEAEFVWTGGQNYPRDHIKTLEELLIATNVDPELWKVKNYTVNKWDVTSWRSKEAVTIQNFQVKAALEKNFQTIKERAIGDLFREMVGDYMAPVYKVRKKDLRNIENNLFEVTLFDLHLGKLAWGAETGENFDTKIAADRFIKTIADLIHKASGFQYQRILFPIGSDFFNSDNLHNTTTKGTPQEEDLRWKKTFNVGCTLLVTAIDMLKQSGVPVDVVVIPGNHDFERSYYLGEFLHAWFRNDKQVDIDNGASPRKYYRFGKLLLGLTHGNEESEVALRSLMTVDIESKPQWSETEYHEFHVGHVHRKREEKFAVLDKKRMTGEDLGITVRYLSSLTGTEEWHHKKGFVGATKAGEAFIWNAERGLTANLNANLVIE